MHIIYNDVTYDWHCFSLQIKSFNKPNNNNNISASQRNCNQGLYQGYSYRIEGTNADD